MKVSIYTMYFLPDFGSGPILMNELAGYLARAGRDVEVVTTVPRRVTAEFRRSLYSVRDGGGFMVKRFRTNSTPQPLGRLAAWNIYTAGAFLEMIKRGRGDVLFLRTPPLQTAVPAFLARWLRGPEILVSVQDIHPDLAIEAGILRNRAGKALARMLEKFVYRAAAKVVVISETFRANLLAKGVPMEKIRIIPNWVDTSFLRPLPKDNRVSRKLGLEDKFVVMYSGTISISSNRALAGALEAAARLRGERKVLLVIVGEGLEKENLMRKAESLGLQNVAFLPFQPYADLPELLASSDVLLVPLDREKSTLSVPSKLYDFMAASRPILGLTPESSEVATVIKKTGCGAVLDPSRPAATAEAILSLVNSPEKREEYGRRAREFVEQNYAASRVLPEYDRLICSIAGHQ